MWIQICVLASVLLSNVKCDIFYPARHSLPSDQNSIIPSLFPISDAPQRISQVLTPPSFVEYSQRKQIEQPTKISISSLYLPPENFDGYHQSQPFANSANFPPGGISELPHIIPIGSSSQGSFGRGSDQLPSTPHSSFTHGSHERVSKYHRPQSSASSVNHPHRKNSVPQYSETRPSSDHRPHVIAAERQQPGRIASSFQSTIDRNFVNPLVRPISTSFHGSRGRTTEFQQPGPHALLTQHKPRENSESHHSRSIASSLHDAFRDKTGFHSQGPVGIPNIRSFEHPSFHTSTLSQYRNQDFRGRYSFGYDGDSSSRHEIKDNDGTVRGSFSYLDPFGKIQSQKYIADAHGFRVLGTNLPVGPSRKKRFAGSFPASTGPLWLHPGHYDDGIPQFGYSVSTINPHRFQNGYRHDRPQFQVRW